MITAMVSAISEALTKLFSWRETSVKEQTTTEVLNDKRDLESACVYAEAVIKLVEEKAEFIKPRFEKRFKELAEKFRHAVIRRQKWLVKVKKRKSRNFRKGKNIDKDSLQGYEREVSTNLM